MIISRVQLVSPHTLMLIPTKVGLLSWNIPLVSLLKSDGRNNNKLESGNSSQTHVWSLAKGIYSNNLFSFQSHGTIFSWFHHCEVTCSNVCLLKETFEIPKRHLAESHFNSTTCGSATLTFSEFFLIPFKFCRIWQFFWQFAPVKPSSQ